MLQNAFAAAQAQLDAAKANLEQSELNLGYTKVYAPVDGYLTNVNTSPGAYVHAGEQFACASRFKLILDRGLF